MTATYDQRGIQFMYPANWALQDNVAPEPPFDITLETPGGGLWILSVSEAGAETDELLKDAVATLESQFDCLELTPIDETIEDLPVKGFDAFFYCLDLLVCAKIRAITTNEFVFVILAQAENREFDKLGKVFDAVTISLLKTNLSTA